MTTQRRARTPIGNQRWRVRKNREGKRRGSRQAAVLPDPRKADEVRAEWRSGDSDETWEEVLRVARMEGAYVKVTWGNGDTIRTLESSDLTVTHDDVLGSTIGNWSVVVAHRGAPRMRVVATAPKPAEPEWVNDPAVHATVDTTGGTLTTILWRADDGRWSPVRGGGDWYRCTYQLRDVTRLSEATRAELADLIRGEA